MTLTVVETKGARFVEADADEPLMSSVRDADRVIEACYGGGATGALLYGANLTPAFFDLSSGEAGAILQKLRNYRIRLAVVCSPGATFSSRFGEMVAEERHGTFFAVFGTAKEARDWLVRRDSFASEGEAS
jgi:Domain of unknown function (DUF4180)